MAGNRDIDSTICEQHCDQRIIFYLVYQHCTEQDTYYSYLAELLSTFSRMLESPRCTTLVELVTSRSLSCVPRQPILEHAIRDNVARYIIPIIMYGNVGSRFTEDPLKFLSESALSCKKIASLKVEVTFERDHYVTVVWDGNTFQRWYGSFNLVCRKESKDTKHRQATVVYFCKSSSCLFLL